MKAALSPRSYLRKDFFRAVLRIMGMDADRGVDGIELPGDFDIAQVASEVGAYGEEGFYPGILCPLHHRTPVLTEHVEMAVRIDQSDR